MSGAGDTACGLLLLQGWRLATQLRGQLSERLQRTRRNTHLHAAQADGLEVDVLATFGRDIGVAAGIPKVGALAGELVDAGHRLVDCGAMIYESGILGKSTMFSLLTQNPLLFLVWLIAFLVALSVHEFCHALVATQLGDSTAERMGRLTLNPAAHIDPLGLLAVIFIGFGWGKPVPFNSYNLKWPKWGPVLIAAAGPASNFIMAVISSLLIVQLAPHLSVDNLLMAFLVISAQLNIALMIFNLVPLPPLDGSKALIALLSHPKYVAARQFIEQRGPYLLLIIILADSFLNLGIFSTLFGWGARLLTALTGVPPLV